MYKDRAGSSEADKELYRKNGHIESSFGKMRDGLPNGEVRSGAIIKDKFSGEGRGFG